MIVTEIAPGFTVRWLSTASRLVMLRVTLTLWPAARVPEAGDTVSVPIKLDGSVIDHDTGPPEAVRMRVSPSPVLSWIFVRDTVSAPGFAGEVAALAQFDEMLKAAGIENVGMVTEMPQAGADAAAGGSLGGSAKP